MPIVETMKTMKITRIMNIKVILIMICHFIWTQVGLGIGTTTCNSGALTILKMEMGAQMKDKRVMTFYFIQICFSLFLMFVHFYISTTLSIYLVNIEYIFSKYRPVKVTKYSLALA